MDSFRDKPHNLEVTALDSQIMTVKISQVAQYLGEEETNQSKLTLKFNLN